MKRLLAILAVIIWAASTHSQQPHAEVQLQATIDMLERLRKTNPQAVMEWLRNNQEAAEQVLNHLDSEAAMREPDCGIDGFYVWRETFPEFDDLTDSAVAWRMQIRPWSLGQAKAEIWAEEWRLFMPAEYHQLGANEVLACMSQMGAAFSSYNQAIEPARPRI